MSPKNIADSVAREPLSVQALLIAAAYGEEHTGTPEHGLLCTLLRVAFRRDIEQAMFIVEAGRKEPSFIRCSLRDVLRAAELIKQRRLFGAEAEAILRANVALAYVDAGDQPGARRCFPAGMQV